MSISAITWEDWQMKAICGLMAVIKNMLITIGVTAVVIAVIIAVIIAVVIVIAVIY